MCSVDRGRVTDDMYETLCAIEYVTRRHFNMANSTHSSSCSQIEEAISSDCDVQFHWCMASSQNSSTSEIILDKVVNKWLTIRGHSFAKSIMEKYKRDTTKCTQKKKPLRLLHD